MDQSNSMFDVLALIAMMVAALGVVNTLTMNVMERTREIGMLRGVGMTRWQVVQMILAEAGLLGLIGGILGLVLGVILSRIFLLAMNAMSGYKLTYVMSPRAIIVGLFIALVVNSKFRGRGLLRTAMLVPWAIPTVVSARLWEMMLRDNQSGVINHFLDNVGLINGSEAWLANPDLHDRVNRPDPLSPTIRSGRCDLPDWRA